MRAAFFGRLPCKPSFGRLRKGWEDNFMTVLRIVGVNTLNLQVDVWIQ
jgi:hypothetical protein